MAEIDEIEKLCALRTGHIVMFPKCSSVSWKKFFRESCQQNVEMYVKSARLLNEKP